MKSKASLMAMLAIAAGTLLGAASGCELIANVDRNKIETGGAAGTTTTPIGGGGTGGVVGANGGVGGSTGCTDDASCPAPAGECKVAKCDVATGVCSEEDAADGTDAKTQMDGDCNKEVCMGGAPVNMPDDDPDDDGNDCTADACDNGSPVAPPTGIGTACSEGTKKVCDGNGACVECNDDGDCSDPLNPVCSGANNCIPATCNDQKKNGDETDLDCGGSCDPCADLLACKIPADCASVVCTAMVCQVPTCSDTVKNGTEGDVDCGATCPNKCAPDQNCNGDADCVGNQCSAAMNGTCTPNCNDSVKNNTETDVDCGLGCTGCAVGLACGNADTNCINTAFCNAGTCEAKKANGTACGGNNQCTNSQCVDTVCCNSACGATCNSCLVAGSIGTCTLIPINTDPDNECMGNGGADVCDGSGACSKATGAVCGAGSECATGQCIDLVCCQNACGGLCKACSNAKTGQPNGTCANVTMNTDPDGECVASLTCTGGACSPLLADGMACTNNLECVNSHCVDGVCCNVTCGALCQACSAAKKGQGADGVCGNIKIHTDPDLECAGTLECNGSGACNKANGQNCSGDADCLNDHCTDSLCCDMACAVDVCKACNLGGAMNGVCSPIPAGADPGGECNGGIAPDCNGNGGCGLGQQGSPCVPNATNVCFLGMAPGKQDCPANGICPAP